MSYTVQSPEQLRENVVAFKRLLGPKTVLNLVPEQGMTQEQLKQCTQNSAAFDVRMSAVNTNAEGLVDYSVQNIADAYKFLRDNGMLKFEVAPVINKVQTLTDHRGNIVRDLRQEKADAKKRADEEARQPRKTFEGELKKAETRAAVNRTIEETRAQISSFRGSTHSKTYQIREEAQKILDTAIQNDRSLGGIATAASDIKLLMRKAWD